MSGLKSWLGRYGRLLRVLAVLSVLLGSAALAAGCETNLPITTPSQGGSRVSLETFVPDPACWIQQTAKEVRARGLYTYATWLGKMLIVASIAIAGLKMLRGGTATPLLQAVAVGLVLYSSVNGYANQTGAGWTAAKWMMGAWQTTYVASSNVGQAVLNNQVLKQVERLDKAFTGYVVGSMQLDFLNLATLATGTDPTTTGQLSVKTMQNNSVGSVLGASTGVGYFALLGMFSVYAALIWSSGVLVLLTIIALPVVLGLTTLGSVNWLRITGTIWLSNLLSVLVLPIMMSVLTSVVLVKPLTTLADQMEYNAKLTSQAVDRTREVVSSCVSSPTVIVFPGRCILDGVVGVANVRFSTIEAGTTGLITSVFVLLVLFTVAMTQLRRIPANIDRILGEMGGGESSGVMSSFTKGRMPRVRWNVGGRGGNAKAGKSGGNGGGTGGGGGGSSGGGGGGAIVPRGPSTVGGGGGPAPVGQAGLVLAATHRVATTSRDILQNASGARQVTVTREPQAAPASLPGPVSAAPSSGSVPRALPPSK